MTESQVPADRDRRWWVPGLVCTVLVPVWFFGFLILNVIATLAKFGDTGCNDGSGSCMGAGPEAKSAVAALLGAAALAAVIAWLLAIGVSTPSH
jgi:hypothetical protein